MTDKAKILFISYSGPLPVTDGKRQRTSALLKALEEEYLIDYMIIDNEQDYNLAIVGYNNPAVNFIFYRKSRAAFGYHFGKIIGLVFGYDRNLSKYIIALNSLNNYVFAFSRYISPVSNIPISQKIVCDIDDDFVEVYKSRIEREDDWLKKVRLQQIYLLNLGIYNWLLKRIDLALFVKKEDNKRKGLLVPNLPFQFLLKRTVPFHLCTSHSILYVGKLSYEPNLIGILWFLKEVWPNLIKNLPSVRLTLVSNTPVNNNELLEILAKRPHIDLLLNVENLADVYTINSVVIAPVFEGGGSSIKIVEAILMGRPVITTSFGARGFKEANTKKFLITHDSPSAFLAGILFHFESIDHLSELQKNIHSWAISKYSFDVWKANLLQNLRSFA